MIDHSIRLLAESVCVVEHVIAQLSSAHIGERCTIAERHWGTYSKIVSALMSSGRLYEAVVYAERAKALAFLPEANLAPPPGGPEEAMASILDIVERVLDDGTAILSYFMGDDEAFGWVVRRGKLTLFGKRVPWVRGGPIAPRLGQRPFLAALDLLLRVGYRGRVDAPKGPSRWHFFAGRDLTLNEAFDWHRESQTPDVDAVSRLFHPVGVSNQVAAATTLYQTLFKPAEPVLEGVERIVVIPDGPLHYLPFEAMIKGEALGDYPQPSAETHFLAKDYVFSYVPSLYSLSRAYCTDDTGGGQRASWRFVGFGNPTLPSSTAGICGGTHLEPIPSTEEEVKAVATMFATSGGPARPRAEIYLGEHATKQNLCKRAPSATHLHIATHGLFFDDRPDDSVLIFSSDEKDPDSPNAKSCLTPREIVRLKLNANLVVLSACRSGLGNYRRGGGLHGIPQAFWRAGAKSVLVSLWNVADEEAVVFMRYFYDGLLSGQHVAHACASAKREMIKRNPDPFYWSPFVVHNSF